MTLRRSLLWLLPIAALSGLGFAAMGGPLVEPGLLVAKSGVVLDAKTRQPLVGAHVVVRWLQQSQAGGKVEGQCLARAVARTDERGHYTIPASDFAISAQRTRRDVRYFWDAYAYAPGYANAAARLAHPRALASTVPASQDLEPIVLAVDHAAPEQRLGTLADTLSRFGCQPFAKQEPTAIAEQIYAEAYAAACLPEPNGAANLLARLRGDRLVAAPCEQFRQASNAR